MRAQPQIVVLIAGLSLACTSPHATESSVPQHGWFESIDYEHQEYTDDDGSIITNDYFGLGDSAVDVVRAPSPDGTGGWVSEQIESAARRHRLSRNSCAIPPVVM